MRKATTTRELRTAPFSMSRCTISLRNSCAETGAAWRPSFARAGTLFTCRLLLGARASWGAGLVARRFRRCRRPAVRANHPLGRRKQRDHLGSRPCAARAHGRTAQGREWPSFPGPPSGPGNEGAGVLRQEGGRRDGRAAPLWSLVCVADICRWWPPGAGRLRRAHRGEGASSRRPRAGRVSRAARHGGAWGGTSGEGRFRHLNRRIQPMGVLASSRVGTRSGRCQTPLNASRPCVVTISSTLSTALVKYSSISARWGVSARSL